MGRRKKREGKFLITNTIEIPSRLDQVKTPQSLTELNH